MIRQLQIKCEQIARMIVKGMPKTRIAIEMSMSYDGLCAITKRADYLEIEEEIRATMNGKMDARLAQRAQMRNDLSEEVEDAVPEAMRVIIEAATKKKDLRAALALIDRDPKRQFAQNKAATTQLTAAGTIESTSLAQAVHEADLTHKMVSNPVVVPVKPAEA